MRKYIKISQIPACAMALKLVVIGASLSALSVPAYACQIPKSYYSNVFCTASDSYYLALKDSGQPVALINKQGRRVADLSRYNSVDVSKINAGLLPVQRRGRIGYVNMSGQEVIPAVYDVISGDSQTKGWSRAVSNNRIVVKRGGRFGVIDTNNRIIVPFSANYQTISDYSNNVAKATTRNGIQWLDMQGKPTADPTRPTAAASRPVAANSRPQTVARSGVQPQSSVITERPMPSAMDREVWQPEMRDGKWGFVNRNSVPMITFSFNQVTPFSEGLAGVRMDDKWGFVNLAGELVIPFDFDESSVNRGRGATYKGVQPFMFTGGKAWVGNAGNGAQMCINLEGKYVSCQ